MVAVTFGCGHSSQSPDYPTMQASFQGELMFTWYLTYNKLFICDSLFHFHKSPPIFISFFPFWNWGNWGSERLPFIRSPGWNMVVRIESNRSLTQPLLSPLLFTSVWGKTYQKSFAHEDSLTHLSSRLKLVQSEWVYVGSNDPCFLPLKSKWRTQRINGSLKSRAYFGRDKYRTYRAWLLCIFIT